MDKFSFELGGSVRIVNCCRMMIALGLLGAIGCGSGAYDRSDADIKKITGKEVKKVVPISGSVKLDGQGQSDVYMYLHKKSEIDSLKASEAAPKKKANKTNQGGKEGKFRVEIPTSSPSSATPSQSTTTGKDGKYCWTTYRSCDGLEPGEYILTFKHIPRMRPNGRGEDLFKGRYENVKKSEFTLTVVEGKPQQDVNYDLTSK